MASATSSHARVSEGATERVSSIGRQQGEELTHERGEEHRRRGRTKAQGRDVRGQLTGIQGERVAEGAGGVGSTEEKHSPAGRHAAVADARGRRGPTGAHHIPSGAGRRGDQQQWRERESSTATHTSTSTRRHTNTQTRARAHHMRGASGPAASRSGCSVHGPGGAAAIRRAQPLPQRSGA